MTEMERIPVPRVAMPRGAQPEKPKRPEGIAATDLASKIDAIEAEIEAMHVPTTEELIAAKRREMAEKRVERATASE